MSFNETNFLFFALTPSSPSSLFWSEELESVKPLAVDFALVGAPSVEFSVSGLDWSPSLAKLKMLDFFLLT